MPIVFSVSPGSKVNVPVPRLVVALPATAVRFAVRKSTLTVGRTGPTT